MLRSPTRAAGRQAMIWDSDPLERDSRSAASGCPGGLFQRYIGNQQLKPPAPRSTKLPETIPERSSFHSTGMNLRSGGGSCADESLVCPRSCAMGGAEIFPLV